MFNNIKTKWLAGIFALLAALTVIVIIANNSKSTISRNRTFKSEITDFDTAKVTQIIIYPKMQKNKVVLSKTGNIWKVSDQNKRYNADRKTIESMINTLASLRATRVAANEKSQWKQYEVTDSAASRVQLFAGKKMVVDLYLGKLSYQQPKNTNPYYYYQQQGKMTSYIRPAKDKKVYAVDGLLALSFNRQASDFRDRTVIRGNKDTWNRLSFNGPGNTYDIIKKGNNWTINGLPADSSQIAGYLTSLAWLSSPSFADESLKISDKPVYTLTIEGENLATPVKISAFESDTTHGYIVSSSLNEGSYFSGKQSSLMDKIFKPADHFLTKEKVDEMK